jgi:hypothetical protein
MKIIYIILVLSINGYAQISKIDIIKIVSGDIKSIQINKVKKIELFNDNDNLLNKIYVYKDSIIVNDSTKYYISNGKINNIIDNKYFHNFNDRTNKYSQIITNVLKDNTKIQKFVNHPNGIAEKIETINKDNKYESMVFKIKKDSVLGEYQTSFLNKYFEKGVLIYEDSLNYEKIFYKKYLKNKKDSIVFYGDSLKIKILIDGKLFNERVFKNYTLYKESLFDINKSIQKTYKYLIYQKKDEDNRIHSREVLWEIITFDFIKKVKKNEFPAKKYYKLKNNVLICKSKIKEHFFYGSPNDMLIDRKKFFSFEEYEIYSFSILVNKDIKNNIYKYMKSSDSSIDYTTKELNSINKYNKKFLKDNTINTYIYIEFNDGKTQKVKVNEILEEININFDIFKYINPQIDMKINESRLYYDK